MGIRLNAGAAPATVIGTKPYNAIANARRHGSRMIESRETCLGKLMASNAQRAHDGGSAWIIGGRRFSVLPPNLYLYRRQPSWN